jgi:outer membrane protein assembly factor BamB
METVQIEQTTSRKPLRLWPGVAIVALQLLGLFVIPRLIPSALIFGVLGGVVGGLMILVWWAFFSRAPKIERWGLLILMIVCMLVTSRLIHVSIATGMMGLMFPIYGITYISMALAIGVALSHRLSEKPRRLVMLGSVLLACAVWTLLRTGGITASADSALAWRWSQTAEERLLAQTAEEPELPSDAPAATESGPEWIGFRGADRDGVVRGVRIETNWATSPPVELWRRQIGPGWSSFAVRGDRIYTQEQRGENEIVSCYNLSSGKPVWTHKDATRFYESNAGAGPRGTPTLGGSRIYSFGATGILNALDAKNGSVIWSRNAATDTETKVPGWGFASSPLLTGDIVVVAVAGTLAAYDQATGEQRWIGPNGGGGYSSPQQVVIAGVPQIVLMCGPGAMSLSPADGKLLWQHPLLSNTRIVQPALTAEGDLLVSDGEGSYLYRIAPANGPGGWTVEERWMSEGLKPYFNDFVVHKGHAYGLDNGLIACIDVERGERKWAGGSYGAGQLVLLADQDVLLVVSEEGKLALVGATPERFAEISQFPAIKGKTWNHPVVAGDVLLVRNGEEMVAFRLSRQGN